MSKSIETESLMQRIVRLTVEKVHAVSAAKAAREVASRAEHIAGIDSMELKIAREAARLTRDQAAKIDEQLSEAHAQRRLGELNAQLPRCKHRLEAATDILTSRNRRAGRVQTMLEEISDELHAMDEERKKLLALEDETDRGPFAPHVFAEGNSRARLLIPLGGCIGGTSYQGVVRRQLLAPRQESFAELEQEAGRCLIARLKHQVSEIEQLMRSKKGAA